MCGIAGFFSAKRFPDDAADIARRMSDTIAHRGPDASGIWADSSNGIVIAHRRLSILDLSDAGSQPMQSASGNLVIAFNGEIYNHDELRRATARRRVVDWKGHSDTESLLECIDSLGLIATLQQAKGMFALALWDRRNRQLFLARDRIGEKPLFYGWQGDTFLFGSELKAMRVHPAFEHKVDPKAVASYFSYGYVPAPASIYSGIRKLPPGTIANFDVSGGSQREVITPYYSFIEIAKQGERNTFKGDLSAAASEINVRLGEAVKSQMIADVPIGAFLSGGIDSSLIVSLMQVHSAIPIQTFSIGFEESSYDETPFSRSIAKHLKTNHLSLIVRHSDALDVIPRLPEMYDEPLGDPSAIPTFLVSQLAKRHVTVALSGDAGDELFGGYGRFFNWPAERAWRLSRALPLLSRDLLRAAETLLDKTYIPYLQKLAHRANLSAALKDCNDELDVYRHLLRHWHNPPLRCVASANKESELHSDVRKLKSVLGQKMAFDMLTFLPDAILSKVDRASMHVSLETRIPFLDRDVIDFAFSLPDSLRHHGRTGKLVLREALKRYVPGTMFDRPKMGFGVPVDIWLRGPLKPWAEDLMSFDSLNASGLLDPHSIRTRWAEHLSGKRNWREPIWLVLMFQSWWRSASGAVQNHDLPNSPS
jgi:asparagine synthase (glutamine-hydrolysing)